MERNFSTTDLSQTVLNFLLIAGGFSVALYLIGYLNYLAFYGTLGVSSKFLDGQYYDYVFNGFLESFPLLVALPFFFIIFLHRNDLKMMKKELTAMGKELNADKSNQIEIARVNNLIKEIEDLENNYISFKPGKQFFISFLCTSLVAVLAFHFKFYSASFAFLNTVVIFALLYAMAKFVNRVASAGRQIIELLFAFPLFLTAAVILPLAGGYIEAKFRQREKGFDSYTLILPKKLRFPMHSLFISEKTTTSFTLMVS